MRVYHYLTSPEVRGGKILKTIINICTKNDEEEVYEYCAKILQTQRLKGIYYEFGVGSGNSMIYCHNAMKGIIKNYVGIDTFSGLPTPEDIDKNFFRKGEYSYSARYVKNRLMKIRIRPILHQGIYPQSCEQLTYDDLLLARIDFDLYAPTIEAIKNVCTKIVVGGLIVIDDCYTPGIIKALNESGSVMRKNNVFKVADFNKLQVYMKMR